MAGVDECSADGLLDPDQPLRPEDEVVEESNFSEYEGPSGNLRNPMMDPVVLARFFELCDLSDLRRFRLVCKEWRDLSLTRWRADMILVIDESDMRSAWFDMDDSRELLLFKNISTWDDDLWSWLEYKPFQSYRLKGVTFKGKGKNDDETNWEPIVEKFGSSMRFLHLNYGFVDCVESLEKLIFEDTPHLESLILEDMCGVPCNNDVLYDDEEESAVNIQPNLKNLKLEIFCEDLAIPFRRIFQHFPNIERLELVGFDYCEIAEILPPEQRGLNPLVRNLEVLSQSQGHKKKKRLPRIKSLDIYDIGGEQEPGVVKRLIQLNQMKLESLRFTIAYCEDEGQSFLPRVLDLHGKSLKKLYLQNDLVYNENVIPRGYDNFPCTSLVMSSLTELHLRWIVCRNLNFLVQTPNLKVLQLLEQEGTSVIDGTDVDLLGNFVLPQVVEFYWSFNRDWNARLSEQHLEMLTRLMPNVERFVAPLTLQALQSVCRNWKELRSLRTSMRGLNDSAITGKLAGHGDVLIPNLTQLKYLHTISIRHDTNLTDVSVYDGFLTMSHLHSLKVTMSEVTSDDAFRALFKKFPGTKLSRHVPYNFPKERRDAMEKLNRELWLIANDWKRDYGFP